MSIQYKSVVILLLVHSFQARQNNALADDVSHSSGCEPGSDCDADELRPCPDKLFRWNPVKVGHVRELRLDDKNPSRKYKMITRAVHPPLFEIPHFLSNEECDYVIKRVEDIGMSASTIHMDLLQEKHRDRLKASIGHANNSAGHWRSWDTNFDNQITMDEIHKFAVYHKKLHLTEEEIKEMIESLKLEELNDGKIDSQEWQSFRTEAVDMYFNDLKQNHPLHRDRFSEQQWLFQGKSSNSRLQTMRNRLRMLTRLPRKIIQGSEPLQVVKYGVRGHYHAHYDVTGRADYPNGTCCHFNLLLSPQCRLCRYITVLYYLNDVEEGGETAFPIADAEKFNETEFRNRRDGDRYNLSKFCKTANVVVKPEKGKAIMWYNFELDQESGWMGGRDDRSLHGGCDILKGTKYVANNWIPAPEPDSAHLTSNYLILGDDDFDEDI